MRWERAKWTQGNRSSIAEKMSTKERNSAEAGKNAKTKGGPFVVRSPLEGKRNALG